MDFTKVDCPWESVHRYYQTPVSTRKRLGVETTQAAVGMATYFLFLQDMLHGGCTHTWQISLCLEWEVYPSPVAVVTALARQLFALSSRVVSIATVFFLLSLCNFQLPSCVHEPIREQTSKIVQFDWMARCIIIVGRA